MRGRCVQLEAHRCPYVFQHARRVRTRRHSRTEPPVCFAVRGWAAFLFLSKPHANAADVKPYIRPGREEVRRLDEGHHLRARDEQQVIPGSPHTAAHADWPTCQGVGGAAEQLS